MKSINALVAIFVAIIFSGCAALHVPEVPQHTVPANAKVGLLINVGDNPSHAHVGTTLFNNFEKKLPYDWNMKEEIFQIYKEKIESSTNLKVIDLHRFGINKVAELDFVDVKNKQWSVVKANSRLRDTLLEENLYAVN